MPLGTRRWPAYAAAATAVAVAWVVRALLQPVLGEDIPYATFFLAVLVSAWLGGLKPALLATGLGLAVSLAAFVPLRLPTGGWDVAHVLGAAVFLVVSVAIALIGEAMRRARNRAREHLRTAKVEKDAAHESQERLQLALEAGRMGTWNRSLLTDRVEWSPGLAAIHGMPAGMFGNTIQEIQNVIHPEDRERVMRAIARTIEQGAPYHVEYRVVWRDGSIHWVEGRGRLVRDEDGHAAELVGVGIDIDARKRLEGTLVEKVDALQNAEERIRAVLDNVSEGIITVDESGTIETLNPAAEKLFGYEAPEMQGRNIGDFVAKVGGSRAEPAARTRPGFSGGVRSAARSRRGPVEITGIRKDGSTFPMDVSVGEVHLGARRLLTGVVRDITERRRHEEGLKLLGESGSAVGDIADEGSILQGLARAAVPGFSDWCAVDLRQKDGSVANAVFLRRGEISGPSPAATGPGAASRTAFLHSDGRSTGADPRPHDGSIDAADATGDPHAAGLDEAVDPLVGQPDRAEDEAANGFGRPPERADRDPLAAGDPIRDGGRPPESSDTAASRVDGMAPGSLAALAADGSTIRVPFMKRKVLGGVITFGMSDSKRRFTEVERGFAEEIGRRTTIAMDNAQLYADLRAEDVRKDEFLATLAHELRNPLAPISNAVHIMQFTNDPQLNASARVTLERQVQHMVRLIDDLMDISRISLNKLALRKERIDLASVVYRALEASRPQIDAAGHRLSLELPPYPVFLNGDLTRLSQALSALLNNASKYTDRGGRIRVDALVRGGAVEIRVKDSGMGIPPESLERVFDMFVQIDHSLERTHGGLGIGLTLVRRVVEMHGGKVSAVSGGPGSGSEFTIRLPIVEVEETTASAAPARSASRSVSPSDTRRILIVDDNVDAVESLRLLLELKGHEVKTAHDGLEALQIAEEFPADLIFLDIGMPRLNGYEAARRIRELESRSGRRAVLVALTGWGQERDIARSKQAGFDHHVVKPLETGDLDRLLEQTIDARTRKR